jgi:hypothetical protein
MTWSFQKVALAFENARAAIEVFAERANEEARKVR